MTTKVGLLDWEFSVKIYFRLKIIKPRNKMMKS